MPPLDFGVDQKAFYHAYGAAMGQWSQIEYTLGNYFIHITGMDERLGRKVFFSARSFLGRIEMLEAAILFAKVVPSGREFLTGSILKVRKWASARNILAHEMHAIIMQQGRKDMYMAISPLDGKPIGIEAISRAGENFFWLGQALIQARGKKKLLREPELCRELPPLLPDDAFAEAPRLTELRQLLTRIAPAGE